MASPKRRERGLLPTATFNQEILNIQNQINSIEEAVGLSNTIMLNELELFYV
jgi:hypothetical protein